MHGVSLSHARKSYCVNRPLKYSAYFDPNALRFFHNVVKSVKNNLESGWWRSFCRFISQLARVLESKWPYLITGSDQNGDCSVIEGSWGSISLVLRYTLLICFASDLRKLELVDFCLNSLLAL